MSATEQKTYWAYDEGGKDEIVHTFSIDGSDRHITIVTDKKPSGPPFVSPSKNAAQAQATHAEYLAKVNAGTAGEFDTEKVNPPSDGA